MKLSILSWNVRGLNKRDKRLRVSNLLRDWNADVVCLQETKIQCMSRNIVRSLWGRNHVDWCCLDSCGASGGILIMWDTRVVEKVDVCVGTYSLAVSFKNVVDLSAWAYAEVYGPNLDRDRRFIWDELAGVLSWWNLPWCIGGDFNVTRFPSERSGGARLDSAMMGFSDFISEQGLMDLPLAGGAFTWSVSQDPPLWSRIDQFLISPDLEAW
ncbi:uncharacterized protein LOC132162996 [Corylus avellana]|uniref:uncharacterized protein LOC132162996 n=1 Tax=Corylus avellana TaxID=13451 RepID=UPI00286BD2A5|nr:uncharacterized protein LOC132162996 [Corylus avellana]